MCQNERYSGEEAAAGVIRIRLTKGEACGDGQLGCNSSAFSETIGICDYVGTRWLSRTPMYIHHERLDTDGMTLKGTTGREHAIETRTSVEYLPTPPVGDHSDADAQVTVETYSLQKKASLNDLPLDIFYMVSRSFLPLEVAHAPETIAQICAYLCPARLVSLTMVNHALRRVLLSAHAGYLWDKIFEENDFPDPPRHFSELHWVMFLSGVCQVS